MGAGECNLRFGENRAACHVFFDGLLKSRIALWGVMKIGNGVVQARCGQVGEQMLKLPKGACGLEGLLRRLDGIVGAGVFDKLPGSPKVALRILMPTAA